MRRHDEEFPGNERYDAHLSRLRTEFVFSAGEQAYYQERAFSNPQRCPTCRAKRKAEHGSSYAGHDHGESAYAPAKLAATPRQMYTAICSHCGKTTDVPFLPRSERPVYCRECFATHRAAATNSYSSCERS